VIDVLAKVGAHLREHFARAGIVTEPDEASVTFLGTERLDVLRFGPDEDGISHYVSLGCSRHPMFDPTEMVTDALHGPRAEVVVALRGPSPKGLARSLAILAAAPAVEGLILEPDALIGVFGGPEFLVHYPNGDVAYYTTIAFRARVVGGTHQPVDGEMSEVRHFSQSECASLNMSASSRVISREAFAGSTNPYFRPAVWTP